MKKTFLSTLVICLTFTLFSTSALAIFGGTAVNKAADRGPHQTVGGLFWKRLTPETNPIESPCTAVLLCGDVIVTTFHCLNVVPQGPMYFTLVENVNGLPGPAGVKNPSHYLKVAKNYQDGGNAKRTRKVLKDTWRWAGTEVYLIRQPTGRFLRSGMVMVQLDEPFPADLKYPNIISKDFKFKHGVNLPRPRDKATKGEISGYGDTKSVMGVPTGDGNLKKGILRFTSWFSPLLRPQGRNTPKPEAREAFFIQFVGGLAKIGNAYEKGVGNPCMGDSGGPVYADNRLAGILDLTTDRGCIGANPRGGIFYNLQYKKNRDFMHNYMAQHCSDWRRVNLDSGNNEVGRGRPKPAPEGSDPGEGKEPAKGGASGKGGMYCSSYEYDPFAEFFFAPASYESEDYWDHFIDLHSNWKVEEPYGDEVTSGTDANLGETDDQISGVQTSTYYE